MNLKYKTGAFQDTLFFFVTIVVLIVSGIFFVSVLSPLVNQFKGSSTLGTEAKQALSSADNLGTMQDNIVLIAFIILWITVLVAAWQLDSNPAFFIVMAIIMVVFVMAAGMLGDLTSAFFSDKNLEGGSSVMPISKFIADHLFIVVIAVGFSVMLVMFAKGRVQQ